MPNLIMGFYIVLCCKSIFFTSRVLFEKWLFAINIIVCNLARKFQHSKNFFTVFKLQRRRKHADSFLHLSQQAYRQTFFQFSSGLCGNLCFLALPAFQTTPQPPITPSTVATRKPVGEEVGLSSSQCDGVDKHCSSEYMQNTTANDRDCQGLCSLCGSSQARLFPGDRTSCTLARCAETSLAWSDTSANSSACERSFHKGRCDCATGTLPLNRWLSLTSIRR